MMMKNMNLSALTLLRIGTDEAVLIDVAIIFISVVLAFAVMAKFKNKVGERFSYVLIAVALIGIGALPIVGRSLQLAPALIFGILGIYMIIQFFVEIFTLNGKKSREAMDTHVGKFLERIFFGEENQAPKPRKIQWSFGGILMIIAGIFWIGICMLPFLDKEFRNDTPLSMSIFICGFAFLPGMAFIAFAISNMRVKKDDYAVIYTTDGPGIPKSKEKFSSANAINGRNEQQGENGVILEELTVYLENLTYAVPKTKAELEEYYGGEADVISYMYGVAPDDIFHNGIHLGESVSEDILLKYGKPLQKYVHTPQAQYEEDIFNFYLYRYGHYTEDEASKIYVEFAFDKEGYCTLDHIMIGTKEFLELQDI